LNRKCVELFEKAKSNPRGLRFAEFRRLCGCIGMVEERRAGSHFIYKLACPFFLLSIQKMKDGKAKAYQVRQLVDFIEENDLDRSDREV
jgi:hypothetical protein